MSELSVYSDCVQCVTSNEYMRLRFGFDLSSLSADFQLRLERSEAPDYISGALISGTRAKFP